MNKILIYILISTAGFIWAQRPQPAPKQTQAVAIVGATIHTGIGTALENTAIVFNQGKITQIGGAVPANNVKIINAQGKHIYPGFILVNNSLGLVEIEATKATVDYEEANDITPEMRTLVAFNTDSHVIPTIRTNGILLTQPVMKSGMLNCTSSVMNLDAWNWEDAVVKKDNVLHMIWPQIRKSTDEKRDKEFKEKRNRQLTELKTLLARAKNYEKTTEKDFKLEAVKPIFSGEKSFFVEVNGANEAMEVIKLAQDFAVAKLVLIGDASLTPVLDEIKKNNIPLIVRRVHELPHSQSVSPNTPFEFAKKIADKGILYGLEYGGDMEYMGSRNLPFVAGTTVAFGVDKEKALQSITYNLAQILGIDKDYGSLEVGKSATLFISEGDALDHLTNQVTHAFIDGRAIDLNNQQKELYHRYKEKYK